nr:PREDICTED: uncharacterized protein LOC109038708 [Bemisia tabaci]XP_018909425.1 PREDICTED: uncharacterized protein LOC109038708 [Bemisia tabaci]
MMYRDPREPPPEVIRESVRQLKEWMSKEPHLPSIEDENWLETYFYNNRFSLEKTKAKLAAYYSLKNEYPDYMKNRDPISPAILRAREALLTVIEERETKDGYTLMYSRFGPDPDKFDQRDTYKRSLMLADAMHLEKSRLRKYISIVDCQNLSYKHILKTLPHVHRLANLLNTYSESLQVQHFVNAPDFLYKSIELVRRYLPEKLRVRIRIHTAGSDSIFDSIDKNALASDFGGNGASLDELDDRCQKMLEKHRAWFLQQDEVCATVGYRWKNSDEKLEEMKGSFTQLSID